MEAREEEPSGSRPLFGRFSPVTVDFVACNLGNTYVERGHPRSKGARQTWQLARLVLLHVVVGADLAVLAVCPIDFFIRYVDISARFMRRS